MLWCFLLEPGSLCDKFYGTVRGPGTGWAPVTRPHDTCRHTLFHYRAYCILILQPTALQSVLRCVALVSVYMRCNAFPERHTRVKLDVFSCWFLFVFRHCGQIPLSKLNTLGRPTTTVKPQSKVSTKRWITVFWVKPPTRSHLNLI